jgi:phosphohistidine phosphatase SixA
MPVLRADQRNLTAEGERDVKLMHDAVEKYKIPIGEVITSPMYRCRETADAFGPASVTMVLRKFPTGAETQALVSAAPKPGTNRVLVTHHYDIENHVPGVTPGMIGESEAAVVRPTGDGKVELVGKIALRDWEKLAGVASQPKGDPAKLAADYIAAFNSGDAAKMRAFIESSMIVSPDRPIEARLQTYAKLFEDYGALTVTGTQSKTDEAVALQVRSKRGDIIVTVTASAQQPNRAQSVTFGVLGGSHG